MWHILFVILVALLLVKCSRYLAKYATTYFNSNNYVLANNIYFRQYKPSDMYLAVSANTFLLASSCIVNPTLLHHFYLYPYNDPSLSDKEADQSQYARVFASPLISAKLHTADLADEFLRLIKCAAINKVPRGAMKRGRIWHAPRAIHLALNKVLRILFIAAIHCLTSRSVKTSSARI